MSTFLGFLLGVATSLSAAAIWLVVGERLLRSIGGSSFSLSGTWLAHFKPISPAGSQSVEIITMSHSRDTVRFRLENYNSTRGHIVRCRGMGKFRSSQLSALWYLMDEGGQDSGTFVLRSRSTSDGPSILSGVYSRVVDLEEAGEVVIRTDPYTLLRIDLPLNRRLHRLRRGTYFKDYQELKSWLVTVNRWDGTAEPNVEGARPEDR